MAQFACSRSLVASEYGEALCSNPRPFDDTMRMCQINSVENWGVRPTIIVENVRYKWRSDLAPSCAVGPVSVEAEWGFIGSKILLCRNFASLVDGLLGNPDFAEHGIGLAVALNRDGYFFFACG